MSHHKGIRRIIGRLNNMTNVIHFHRGRASDTHLRDIIATNGPFRVLRLAAMALIRPAPRPPDARRRRTTLLAGTGMSDHLRRDLGLPPAGQRPGPLDRMPWERDPYHFL